LLTTAVLSNANAQNPIQQYVVRRDFFSFYKAAEYTVYDIKEKHVYYRIESKIAILQNIKLIAYPSKQEVGQLQAKLKLLVYEAEFSILDPQSNKRISGLIQQKFKFSSDVFTIEWGEHRITMEKKFSSLTHKFYDSDGDEILAQFRIRLASVFWAKKYDVKIFSNKYPEQIYLLALAARDNLLKKSSIA